MKCSTAFESRVRSLGAASVLLLTWLVLNSWSGEEVRASELDPSTDLGDSVATAKEWVLPEPEQPFGLREGRQLFLHYCATCHGEEGAGDGFNAFNLDPRPRALSDPRFLEQRSDAELYELIRMGGGAAGLSTTMPPWGRTINERGLRYLVKFVRHLASGADLDGIEESENSDGQHR